MRGVRKGEAGIPPTTLVQALASCPALALPHPTHQQLLRRGRLALLAQLEQRRLLLSQHAARACSERRESARCGVRRRRRRRVQGGGECPNCMRSAPAQRLVHPWHQAAWAHVHSAARTGGLEEGLAREGRGRKRQAHRRRRAQEAGSQAASQLLLLLLLGPRGGPGGGQGAGASGMGPHGARRAAGRPLGLRQQAGAAHCGCRVRWASAGAVAGAWARPGARERSGRAGPVCKRCWARCQQLSRVQGRCGCEGRAGGRAWQWLTKWLEWPSHAQQQVLPFSKP